MPGASWANEEVEKGAWNKVRNGKSKARAIFGRQFEAHS